MKFVYAAILLVVIAIGAFLAGSWYHPQKTSKSPIKLSESPTPEGEEEKAGQYPPGTVRVSPERQQTIGLRTGVVEKGPVSHTLRILGRVAIDETRIYPLLAPVDGWVRQVPALTTGKLVKKGELLATFYSPEFLATEQAYVVSLNIQSTRDGVKESANLANLANVQLNRNIDLLRSLGMGDQQIRELAETRKYIEDIRIISPVTGFIVARNIFSPGQRFFKGQEWFRLVDQSRVWIVTDTYEDESQFFQPGKVVQVTSPNLKRTLSAKVSPIQPLFDPATRTLKVRLEADNPGYLLKPDMFVDIEVPVSLPAAVTVPSDAVLDTGLKKTVFVDRENGYFEPREVETGRRLGDRIEITKGLAPGEKIVTAGTFLIDSESRMDLAASGTTGSLTRDPVSGDEVSIRKAEKTGLKSTYRQKTYYFNSAGNRARFEQDPARYLKQP